MMWTFISMKGSRAQPSSWEEMRVKQQALAFYGLAGKGRVRVYSQMLSKKNAPAQTLVTETSTMSILTQTSPQIQMLELRVSPAMSFQVWWGECEQSIISAVPASLANCGHRSQRNYPSHGDYTRFWPSVRGRRPVVFKLITTKFHIEIFTKNEKITKCF